MSLSSVPSDSPFPSDMTAALTCPPLPVLEGVVVVLKVLPPEQMVGLLRCSRWELATAVRAKIEHLTKVRPGAQDYLDLDRFGLVYRSGVRHHRLTDRGRYCVGLLARALARDLKIKIPHAPRGYERDGYTVPQSTS